MYSGYPKFASVFHGVLVMGLPFFRVINLTVSCLVPEVRYVAQSKDPSRALWPLKVEAPRWGIFFGPLASLNILFCLGSIH